MRGWSGRSDLFAKVLSDRPVDRDLLHRWWLWTTSGVPRGAQRFGSPSLQVEFEATRTLLAAAAGVRVPTVVYVGPLDAELSVLITTWAAGQSWASGTAPGPKAVADLHAQVQHLHAAQIAHGDLVADNLMIDGNQVTLVYFGNAIGRAVDADMDVAGRR